MGRGHWGGWGDDKDHSRGGGVRTRIYVWRIYVWVYKGGGGSGGGGGGGGQMSLLESRRSKIPLLYI